MSDVMAANPQHYSMGGFSYGTLCNATASPVPPSQMGVCELFNQYNIIGKESIMDNKYDILQLLRSVADGTTEPEQALLQLKEAPISMFVLPNNG